MDIAWASYAIGAVIAIAGAAIMPGDPKLRVLFAALTAGVFLTPWWVDASADAALVPAWFLAMFDYLLVDRTASTFWWGARPIAVVTLALVVPWFIWRRMRSGDKVRQRSRRSRRRSWG